MAELWTDLIDPAELTGYVREGLSAIERRKGSLAQFLPNREVDDISARFHKGQNGLVDEAKWRAYDAEPEIGDTPPEGRVIIELPAVSRKEVVSEYAQLRHRNASDDSIRNAGFRAADRCVLAIADAVERMRGIVLATGKATITQSNYKTSDDFGRDADLTITANSLWSTDTTDGLTQLETWMDLYSTRNGTEPGAIVMPRRVFRALSGLKVMQGQTAAGAFRRPMEQDVRGIVSSAGLPDIIIYDRRTKSGRVIPDDTLLFLPEPTAIDDYNGTELGATFWGQTLTATDPKFSLVDAEMPGLVAGLWRHQTVPMIAEVVGDAIALPVLANANLSMAVKVL